MIVVLLLGGCSGVCSRKKTTQINRLISSRGIGGIEVGTTITALKKAGHLVVEDKSPRGWRIWSINPGKADHPTGIQVRLQADRNSGEDRTILRLETQDAAYAIDSGVRCGMSVAEAVKRLGAVQLTLYSSMDESPEYASFAHFKGKNIAFWIKSRKSSEAGIYEQNDGGIIPAKSVRSDAYIHRIIVFSGKFQP